MPLTLTDEQLKNFIMSWHKAKILAPDLSIIEDGVEVELIAAKDVHYEELIAEYAYVSDEALACKCINYRTLQVLTDVATMFGIQLPTDERQKDY